jgi:hypothetical protein
MRMECHGICSPNISNIERSKLIRVSARAEFESSKQENDPEVLARALVNGRMALDEVHEKYKAKQTRVQQDFTKDVSRTRTDRS